MLKKTEMLPIVAVLIFLSLFSITVATGARPGFSDAGYDIVASGPRADTTNLIKGEQVSGISTGSIAEFHITCIDPPVADFSARPREGIVPLVVMFTDLSAGSIASYEWDFNNDGIVDSRTKNPSFQYSKEGTYTVRLTVTGKYGTDTEIKTRYIVVRRCRPPPVAAFTATPVSGSAPLTVSFTDESTGSIASYAWDFQNDNVTDTTAQNPSYIYSSAGVYSVKLTVTGPGGTDDEIRRDLVFVVRGIIPLPGYTNPPTDPDGDWLYEDLNGNGIEDLNDIVLFFIFNRWISDNEPVGCFDINGNAGIDFNDVVILFKEMT